MVVPIELATVIVRTLEGGQILILKEKEGAGRSFMVVIGMTEALAIQQHLHGFEPPRPLTHDLLKRLVDNLGASVERVVIADVRGGTFYGQLFLRQRDGSVIDVDCRPSDAIALAVRTGAPLFADESVLAAEEGEY